jgi:hypothetical protein
VSQLRPLFGTSWQGSLGDLAHIVRHVQQVRAFGRLSLRNTERLGIMHIYYRAGKLAHMVGNRGDAKVLLGELQLWKRGSVRFERGVTTREVTLNEEHEQLFENVLLQLYQQGVVATSPKTDVPRVIEGNLLASGDDVKQLIAPWEWQILVEGTRRVSLAVAHLVGSREALSVLQDILDDCSSAFPAFASLKISPNGYLQIVDRSHLDRLSRTELLEGFTAIIATCQYFCSPMIGEQEAHRLIIQALQDIGPMLVNLGVFRVDQRLLMNGSR